MAIQTDTFVKRIPLASNPNLKKAIKDECEIQAKKDKHRRLASAFAERDQVILIFQRTVN